MAVLDRNRNLSLPTNAPGADAGVVIWLTGLSGAGKTTLAGRVAEVLRRKGHRVEILDGDTVRENLCRGLGFTREDRTANVLRVAHVAHLLSRNGVTVIVALISPYRDARTEARRICGRFVEVHVATPLDVCIHRDVKGLYAKARRGEIQHFTGVDDPYEEPLAPEVRIDTSQATEESAVERILSTIDGGGMRGNGYKSC